ncbi:type II secretion system protein [Candidatus Uhrbacteria bacterium]|nr:type II secretion system protein [Candidatus Uhrbacteria bacterium]
MIKSNKKGFTLIELLVVIAIIGLLSTLAVVALNSARQKSRDSKRVADVKQVQTALELYFSDENSYPTEATAIVLGSATASSLSSDGFAGTATGSTYMGLVPSAPTPEDGDCDATNNPYSYVSADGSTYEITFCIGGSVGDLSGGDVKADPTGIYNYTPPAE